MYKWLAKILSSLAISIILMHAVVPHHHHDCCGEGGFVFENEIACQYAHPVHCHNHDCHEHEKSHHPLNSCALQDLLSKLVIGHKSEELNLMLSMVPEMDLFVNAGGYDMLSVAMSLMDEWETLPDGATPLPPTRVWCSKTLRAPPRG